MPVPGPPVLDEETAEALRTLVAKGAAGDLCFTTDDCQSTYEELIGRGVEFGQEPLERPYGIDAGFRAPSGTQLRMIQAPEHLPRDVSRRCPRRCRPRRVGAW